MPCVGIRPRVVPLSLNIICTLGFLLGCDAKTTRFLTTYPTAQDALLGSSFTFEWKFEVADGISVESVEWILEPSGARNTLVNVGANGTPGPTSVPASYSGRIKWTGDLPKFTASFLLMNITSGDANQYQIIINFGPSPDQRKAYVRLNVLEPAHFTGSPLLNQSLTEGQDLILKCEAGGKPQPNITWVDVSKGQVVQKGKGSSTLQINKIARPSSSAMSYVYECQAVNIHGRAAIKKKIWITVQYKAKIVTASSSANTSSYIGQTEALKCVAEGVPVPTLEWTKPDGSQLKRGQSKSIAVDVNFKVEADFGPYKCSAKNTVADDVLTVYIDQLKKPGPPIITSSDEDIQATSLTVRWNPPNDDGGSSVTGYRVIVREQGSKVVKNVSIGNVQQQDFGDLKISTNYILEVSAINVAGEGRPGTKSITTKFEGAPEAAELSITNTSDPRKFELRWTKPKDNRSPITSYTIYTKLILGNGNEEAWVKNKTVSEDVRSYMITLEAGKTFKIVVTASNKLGEAKKEENRVKTIIVPEPTPSTGSSTSDGAPESTVHAGTVAAGGSDEKSTDPVVIGGAVGAVILAIIAVAIGVPLWRRKRQGGKGHGSVSSRDALSADNEGYASDNQRAAVQNLGAGGEGAYADVGGNSSPYAQVDKSKKKPKKPKRKPGEPGELVYADLADFSRPKGGAVPVRPEEIQRSDYADITQFSAPKQEPTYDNLPRADATYANVQAC